MSSTRLFLEQIEIPDPCPVAWESMRGDDRMRFCGQCKENVYDLSAMTRHEAEQLIERSGGQLCVQLYKRTDGKVLTADCEKIRFMMARKVYRRVAACVALFLSMALGGTLWGALGGDRSGSAATATTTTTTTTTSANNSWPWIFSQPPPPPPPIRGKVCIPVPPTPGSQSPAPGTPAPGTSPAQFPGASGGEFPAQGS